MSVFDQFNANPYIRMYAGAPIKEALEVGKVMQGRFDKALEDMNKVDYAMSTIQGIGDADKAYRQQYGAKLQKQMEQFQEAPEMAGPGIKRMAHEMKMDPTLRNMATAAAAKQKWTEEFAKNPEKYGDVASWEMMQAVQRYEADGGAAGGATFQPPQLRELIDENKYMRENASLIKASSNGTMEVDPVKGLIYTATKEQVRAADAQAILKNIMMSDTSMREQMQRQYRYNTKGLGRELSFDDYLNEKTAGVANAVAYTKTTRSAKGYGKGGSGSANVAGMMPTTKGVDNTIDLMTPPSSSAELQQRRATRGNSYKDQELTRTENAVFNKAVDEGVKNGTIDPQVADFYRSIGIDGLPQDKGGSVKGFGAAAGASYLADSLIGWATGKNYDDKAAREYAKNTLGMTDKQADGFVSKVQKGMGNIFSTDLFNEIETASRMSHSTEWQSAANYGFNSDQEAAMNYVVGKDLGSMGAAEVVIDGKVTEVDMGQLNEMFDLNSAKFVGDELTGSGQIEVAVKDREGKGHTIIYTPQKGASNIGAYREQINGQRLAAANTPRAKAQVLRQGLAVSAPELVQQGWKWEQGGVVPAGTFAPIDFGTYGPELAGALGGQLTLGRSLENGRFEVQLNGRNAFENNPEMAILVSQSANASDAIAVVRQAIDQQLAGR